MLPIIIRVVGWLAVLYGLTDICIGSVTEMIGWTMVTQGILQFVGGFILVALADIMKSLRKLLMQN